MKGLSVWENRSLNRHSHAWWSKTDYIEVDSEFERSICTYKTTLSQCDVPVSAWNKNPRNPKLSISLASNFSVNRLLLKAFPNISLLAYHHVRMLTSIVLPKWHISTHLRGINACWHYSTEMRGIVNLPQLNAQPTAYSTSLYNYIQMYMYEFFDSKFLQVITKLLHLRVQNEQTRRTLLQKVSSK